MTLELGTGDTGLVTSRTNDLIENWWQQTDAGGNVSSYNIRPGVYDLTYSFMDYDGVTVKTATRKLIILAPVGDENADGVVDTAADSDLVKNRVTDPLGSMVDAGYPDYPAWRLFRYRSSDANNDRNVNNIDANQIRHGQEKIVPYYKPTDYCS